MADVSYKVLVELEQKGDIAGISGGKLAELDRGVSKIGAGLAGIGNSIASAFTGAVEKVASMGMTLAQAGAVGAFGLITAGVVKFNRELELSQIGLADLFHASGNTSTMQGGMEMASNLMKKMRSDAAALPGEFKDLERIFQMSAVSGLEHGKSAEDIEKLSSRAMAYGIGAAGISGTVVARELAAVLEGHATSANVLSRKLGIDAKDFNKKSYEERFTELSTKLAKHDDAIPYYERSFEGIFTSLKDKAKLFWTDATNPLFESVKVSMGKALEWIDSHKERITEISTQIGMRLAYYWEYASGKIEEWGPKLVNFAVQFKNELVAAFEKIEPIAKYLIDKFGNAEGLKSIGEAYGVAKIGGAATSVMSSFGGMEAVGAIVGGASLGEVLAILAAAGMALYGAWEILTDETSIFYDSANQMWSEISENWKLTMVNMKDAWQMVSPVFDGIAQAMGFVLLGSLTVVSSALHEVAVVTRNVIAGMQDLVFWIEQKTGHMITTADDEAWRKPGDKSISPSSLVALTGTAVAVSDAMAKKSNIINGGGGTHIGKIDIVVQQTGDPDRVARAVLDKLADLKRYRKSSPYAFNYTSGR